MKDQEHP